MAPEVPSTTPSPETVPRATPTVRPEPIKLAVRRAKIKGVEADIVTINGWTAYRFEVDDHEDPTPAKVKCAFDCLSTWPPALTDGSKVEVSGIDRKLVGTVGRVDGDGYTQVTLGGWPLYKFKEDKVPTDAKGEGLACNWSVVKPDGKPVIKKGTGCKVGG
ncbi:COG4315 family predicted lipoprotein [Kribbella sp. CA-253562]|uniref:COG4315 family predicted lipoprotein n=1 Tax=Kribbella sp. CA-253562 TaxID=3239942 RepID=UPI003D9046BC